MFSIAVMSAAPTLVAVAPAPAESLQAIAEAIAQGAHTFTPDATRDSHERQHELLITAPTYDAAFDGPLPARRR